MKAYICIILPKGFVSHSSNFLEQMVVEKDQSRCETASEYMKCLAYIEKNSEVFI